MLVLSRKTGESIVIDGRIVVKVLDIGRGRVQLGIDAPREIPVERSELRQPDRVFAMHGGGDNEVDESEVPELVALRS
jgi:carbon storage regulator